MFAGISPWLRRKLRQDSIDEEVMVDDNFSMTSVDKRGGILDDKKNRHMSYSGRIRCWREGEGGYPGGNTIGVGLGPSPRRTPLSQLDRRSHDIVPSPKLSYPPLSPCRDGSSGSNTPDFSLFRPNQGQDRVLGFPLKGRGLSEFQPKHYSHISEEYNNKRLPLNADSYSHPNPPPSPYDDCDNVSMNQMEFSPDPDHHFRPGSRLTDSLRRNHENSPCLKRINRHHVNYVASTSTQPPSTPSQPYLNGYSGSHQKVVNLPPLPALQSARHGALVMRGTSPTHKKSQSYLPDNASPNSYEQLKLKLKEQVLQLSDKCFNSGKLSSSKLFSKFYLKNDKLGAEESVSSSRRFSGSDSLDGGKVRSFSFGGIPQLQEFSRENSAEPEQHRINPLYVDDGMMASHENDAQNEGYDPILPSSRGSVGRSKSSHCRSSSTPSSTGNCMMSLSVPRNLDFITSNSSTASHSSQGSGSNNSDGDSGILDGGSLFQESLIPNDLSSSSCSNSNGGCCLVRFLGEDGTVGNGSPSSYASLLSNAKNAKQSQKKSGSSYFDYKRSRHHSSSSLKNDPASAPLNFIGSSSNSRSSTDGSKSLRGGNQSLQDLNFQNEQFLNSNENSRLPGEYRLIRVRKLAPFMRRSVVPDDMHRELGITLEKEKNPAVDNGFILRFIHPDSSIAR